MEIVLLCEDNENQYTEYVLSKQDSLLYVSIKYRNMLEELLNDESYYLVAMRENKIKGVLPIFIHRNSKYGNIANSLPFYGSNGAIIADDEETGGELVKAYYKLILDNLCVAATIITSPFEDNSICYKSILQPTFIDMRIGQITKLPNWQDNVEPILLSLFHKMVQRCIKKAVKNDIQVKIENTDEAIDFLYSTHRDNIESIGGIAKEKIFFDIFPKHFIPQQDYNIFVAYKDNKKIAALLVFYFNNTVEYYTPATVDEYRTFQPLSLIVFEAMKLAIKEGYKRWNWGGTWISQKGVYEFKRKWGTEDLNYYYYTNVFNTNILNLDKETVLKNYKNYFVYPFDIDKNENYSNDSHK